MHFIIYTEHWSILAPANQSIGSLPRQIHQKDENICVHQKWSTLWVMGYTKNGSQIPAWNDRKPSFVALWLEDDATPILSRLLVSMFEPPGATFGLTQSRLLLKWNVHESDDLFCSGSFGWIFKGEPPPLVVLEGRDGTPKSSKDS